MNPAWWKQVEKFFEDTQEADWLENAEAVRYLHGLHSKFEAINRFSDSNDETATKAFELLILGPNGQSYAKLCKDLQRYNIPAPHLDAVMVIRHAESIRQFTETYRQVHGALPGLQFSINVLPQTLVGGLLEVLLKHHLFDINPRILVWEIDSEAAKEFLGSLGERKISQGLDDVRDAVLDCAGVTGLNVGLDDITDGGAMEECLKNECPKQVSWLKIDRREFWLRVELRHRFCRYFHQIVQRNASMGRLTVFEGVKDGGYVNRVRELDRKLLGFFAMQGTAMKPGRLFAEVLSALEV